MTIRFPKYVLSVTNPSSDTECILRDDDLILLQDDDDSTVCIDSL